MPDMISYGTAKRWIEQHMPDEAEALSNYFQVYEGLIAIQNATDRAECCTYDEWYKDRCMGINSEYIKHAIMGKLKSTILRGIAREQSNDVI